MLQEEQQQELHGGVVRISYDALIDLLQLPSEWRVMAISFEPMRRNIAIAVSHESLPLVHECEDLPSLEPTYRRKYVQQISSPVERIGMYVYDPSTGKRQYLDISEE